MGEAKLRAPEAATAEFRNALGHEILRTEILRIKALIATGALFTVALTTFYIVSPATVQRIWHEHFDPIAVYAVFLGFIAFEFSVLGLARRQLRLGRDLPYARRFLGALIETSLPSFMLVLQVRSMGAPQAFSFVAPLTYFLFIILSTLRLDFWLSTFTGAVAALELFGLAIFYSEASFAAADPVASISFHAIRSVALLLGGILAGTVGLRIRSQFEASIAAARARDHITNLFGQHVSPQVVERLLAAGTETTSDTRKIAVMFVDIRGFTAAARTRTPQEVVERLDSAFAILVEIVDRNGGIVNKFLGDGFLALFGAPFDDPDAAQRAVTAAREMLDAIARDNAGRDWPLRIGIGLHLGDVVAGNVGSPRRKEYTVIGDTVNFASRIESLNKEFGSQLLISDEVHRAIAEKAADAVSLGEVPIRGYDHPVAVWRLA